MAHWPNGRWFRTRNFADSAKNVSRVLSETIPWSLLGTLMCSGSIDSMIRDGLSSKIHLHSPKQLPIRQCPCKLSKFVQGAGWTDFTKQTVSSSPNASILSKGSQKGPYETEPKGILNRFSSFFSALNENSSEIASWSAVIATGFSPEVIFQRVGLLPYS